MAPAPAELLEVMEVAASAVAEVFGRTAERGLAGTRAGQHHTDLVTDAAAVEVLLGAGFGVLSEESGPAHVERPVVVVLDPLDGSTNAMHGVPWFATSLCAVDADGPVAALVVNLASGERFSAVRGGGAFLDGTRISSGGPVPLRDALVGISGLPPHHLGWGQFRSLGAAALDLCAVACGRLDGFVDCSEDAHGVWDYLGALLVCREAGASVTDARGRELVTLEWSARRTPVAAGSEALHGALVEARRW